MKQKLILLFIALTTLAYSQTDSAYYYIGGIPSYYYFQNDVYSFINSDLSPLGISVDMTKVDKVEHDVNNVNYVYFKATTSDADKNLIINTIESQTIFEKFYPVITKFYDEYYTAEKYFGLDDKILVNFKDPNITETEVYDFANRNNLNVYHYPSINLPGARGLYTFIFSMRDNITHSKTFNNSSIKKAATIYENESLVVESCIPNLLKYSKPDAINDPHYPDMWQINNTLQSPVCAGHSGTLNADAQIDRVWNIANEFGAYQGYTGEGVTIGVIDFHNFDFGHVELAGQFLSGWNCIDTTPITTGIIVDNTQSHGTAVCGIIAAKANNNSGLIGVAYGAKIRPYLIDGSGGAEIIAYQKCLEDNIDVINMSYGAPSGALYEFQYPFIVGWKETHLLDSLGRNGKGTIMIGSKGNSDAQFHHAPSDFEHVLSIIATTPDDHKKEFGDTWYETIDWGSNYGPYADVSAPGYCMFTTDHSAELVGYTDTAYLPDFSGTSAAAPMVSGLAALLLEKDSNLTNREVYNAIMYGADKVGGYDYNFYIDQPGKSQKLAHGRINGYRTVSEIPNSIQNYVSDNIKISYISPFINEIPIIIENANEYVISVFDVIGRNADVNIINTNKNITIDFKRNNNGFYFINFTNKKTNKNITIKVLKNE